MHRRILEEPWGKLTLDQSGLFSDEKCCAGNKKFPELWMPSLDTRGARVFDKLCYGKRIGEWHGDIFCDPLSILETLKDSEDTLRTTLAELAEDKRKQKPNISERKLAEYLADQMGYRGAKNVEALVASRERIAKSRLAVGLGK